MKPPLNLPRARIAGFTLVEIYISMFVFSLLMVAIVATQFFGARVYTLAATKLTSTAAGRKAMNDMRDAIRAAGDVRVGIYSVTNNSFSYVSNGLPQIGNALVIAPTNLNTMNTGTIYFMNQPASNLCSVAMVLGAVQTATLATNIIVYITNYYVFDAEDPFNNIMTNYVNDRVIHIELQFCQWEYPLAGVGGGAMYDYYQLQTRATMRLIDF